MKILIVLIVWHVLIVLIALAPPFFSQMKTPPIPETTTDDNFTVAGLIRRLEKVKDKSLPVVMGDRDQFSYTKLFGVSDGVEIGVDHKRFVRIEVSERVTGASMTISTSVTDTVFAIEGSDKLDHRD